jgi:hypothetical protein
MFMQSPGQKWTERLCLVACCQLWGYDQLRTQHAMQACATHYGATILPKDKDMLKPSANHQAKRGCDGTTCLRNVGPR